MVEGLGGSYSLFWVESQHLHQQVRELRIADVEERPEVALLVDVDRS